MALHDFVLILPRKDLPLAGAAAGTATTVCLVLSLVDLPVADVTGRTISVGAEVAGGVVY